MRQMKYIKLFEAFDSAQISKTLKFVKKSDRERFLGALRQICSSIDAPLSSLSDDVFQYLPYKKAMKLRYESERPVCSSCEGEGKISKPWGRGTRMVKCPRCEGEGTTEAAQKMKYIKFWFNSDGSYVGATVVDGRYHADKRDATNYVKKDITEDVRTLDLAELKTKYGIANGETRIYLQNVSGTGWRNDRKYSQLGLAFIDRDGRLFVVHGNSSIELDQPVGRKWKDYGRYATSLSRMLRDSRNADAKVFFMTDVEEKEDIYWNTPLSIGRYGISADSTMSKDFLKDAHFAIVFDYDTFAYGGKEWNPVSITRGDREHAKKGATAFISDEQIKSANIERYIKAISNIDLSEGIGRLASKVPMVFGGDLALYFIYGEKNFSRFKNMMSDVYEFMAAKDDDGRKSANEKLARRLRETREITNNVRERIEKRIASAKESFVDSADKEKYYSLFDKLEALSKSINQKLLKSKMETIEDMEIMLMKAIGINSAISSDRFSLDYYLRSYLSDLDNTGWRGDTAAMHAMQNLSAAKIDGEIRKLDLISNVIQRL